MEALMTRFKKPTIEEVEAYCTDRANSIDPAAFVDFYESKGWLIGKSPMKCWKAAVRTWERRDGGGKSVRRGPNLSWIDESPL
jgi:hypothetical protein